MDLQKEIKTRWSLPEDSEWEDINRYDSNERFDKRVNGNSILEQPNINWFLITLFNSSF